MNPEWMIQRGDEKHGPYTWDQMREYAADGRVLPTDLAWREGMAQWLPAAQVPDLFAAPAAPVAAVPVDPAAKPKSKGCLGGCLGCLGKLFSLILVLGIIGAGIVYSRSRRPSRNLVVGPRMPAVEKTLGQEGGELVVDQPGSPIHGLKRPLYILQATCFLPVSF